MLGLSKTYDRMDTTAAPPIRLTEFSHGGGCGCKIAPGVLRELIAKSSPGLLPKELLVGIETSDDAAVYRLNDRQAIVATEDAEFDRHFGVNIWRIFVAAVTDIVERRRAQGASTLTQQLARNLKDQFGLTNEKSFERKIREAILAIQIEKRYTKREIFTIYCNQMYLGHGAYGVEAASRLYFNKSNKQLSLEEAALIAGIFQTPSARARSWTSSARPTAATSCCSAWPTSATSRRPRPTPRSRSRRDARIADSRRASPVLRRGGPQHRAPCTARRCSTRTASRCARRSTRRCRMRRNGDRARLRRVDKRHGYRKPKRTSSPSATPRRVRTSGGTGCGRRRRSCRRRHRAEGRAGPRVQRHATWARGLRLDAPHWPRICSRRAILSRLALGS